MCSTLEKEPSLASLSPGNNKVISAKQYSFFLHWMSKPQLDLGRFCLAGLGFKVPTGM